MSVDEALPRRADARRNRAAVLEAAVAVFAERGLEAGVPEIAARAGVGKATVYRSFPTKEHLVAAVAGDRFRWVADVAREACDDPDPGAAFERVVVTIAERQAEDLAVAGTLAASVTLPELEAVRAVAQEAMEALMARAAAAGALRTDATFDDLRVLFTGVSAILRERRERHPAVWRHFGRLVVDALRPR
jgi:AcrR family transcriptional regulator